MNLSDTLQNIERHFNLWVQTFERKKPDVTTNARKTIEAICKASILKIKGDVWGPQIILGKYTGNPAIPKIRLNGNIGALNIQNLIHTISKDELGIIQNNAIYNQFETIRKLGNDGSHDENHPDQIVTWGDMESCHYSLRPIVTWFYEKIMRTNIPPSIVSAFEGNPNIDFVYYSSEKWQELYLSCESFDKRFQYIFVSPEHISDNPLIIQSFAKLPWRLVLDFNSKSDEVENGLLYQFNKLKGSNYQKTININDKPDFDPEFHHYWFYINGSNNIVIPKPDFKSWRKEYANYLSDKLYHEFNKGSRLRERKVVMLGIPEIYAETIVNEFNRVDENNLNFIICPTNSESYRGILDKFDNVEVINITVEEIATGIENTLKFSNQFQEREENSTLIPTRSPENNKTYISIKKEDLEYLHSLGIDLIYKGIEFSVQGNSNIDSFYRGAVISWKDLYEQKDKPRNASSSLKQRIKAMLEENSLKAIDFIHEAGAGGTTISRRLAYDLSTDYPTILLRNYETKKTINGLNLLIDQYTLGRLPILIIIETFEVRNYQQLFSDLANSHKKAIIIRIIRGNISKAKEKRFTLKSTLDLDEINLFEREFSLLVPTRKEYIQNIPKDYKYDPNYISPMLYALTAYGTNYDVKNYIIQSIEDISAEHRKLVGFICIIYFFSQKSVPAELFTSLLGVDRNKCYLQTLLKDNLLLDLLHEEWEGDENLNEWRPRYSILGERTMKILLGGLNAEANWKNNLARWLLDLIKYVGASVPNLDDATKEILLTLFVTRNEESMGSGQEFTEAVRYLQTGEGVAIFESLTTIYPDEESFHAHFARYLYDEKVKIKDYDRAIIEANKALEIKISSSLLHTLGMCYRRKAENLKRNYSDLSISQEDAENQMKLLVSKSVEVFESCIEYDTKNIYGYESSIRVILTGLDFAFDLHKSTSRHDLLNSMSNDWHIKYYDKALFLLQQAISVLDQSKSLEEKNQIQKSASFIYECESQIFKLTNDHHNAKIKYEYLVKNPKKDQQYLRPLYRRMYVIHLLYSKLNNSNNGLDMSDAWEKISQDELKLCIDFLSANLFEDPSNSQNIKLWLEANRYLNKPLSIEECLIEVSSWASNMGQTIFSRLEAMYFLYVLNAIKAISSGIFDPTSIQIVKDMKENIRQLSVTKNEKFCFEWYGNGEGIKKMISFKKFADFKPGFIERHQNIIAEVSGRIKDILSQQNGILILDCGLEAFFVPALGGFTERNKHDKVKFFVGFRYDQIQAWSVLPFDKERVESISNQEYIENVILDMPPLKNTIESDFIIEDTQPKAEKLWFFDNFCGVLLCYPLRPSGACVGTGYLCYKSCAPSGLRRSLTFVE